MKAKLPISACIITLNEADRIHECIQSVSFCQDILVVDSGSTDQTREIASEIGARVMQQAWLGYGLQKAVAVEQAQYDWVLCIDADERISDQLRSEISDLYANNFANCVGWQLPRLTRYLGAWIRHGVWYPDYNLRLFNRQYGNWNSAEIHERVILTGKTGKCKADLLHDPYRSFAEHLATIERYTTLMAKKAHRQGKAFHLSGICLNPWWRFIKSYVLRKGFLDGWRGLLIAILAAHYVRLKYLKLWLIKKNLFN